MNITITRGQLKKILSEEIEKYFQKNKNFLQENNLNIKEIQELLRESMEKNDGV